MPKHPIEDQWIKLRAFVEGLAERDGHDGKISALQWQTMEICFFSGAYALWEEIDPHVDVVPEEASQEHWEAVTNEMEAWLKQRRKRERRQSFDA